MTKKIDPASEHLRPVVVCTDKRGVFFGYAADTTGDPIYLSRARMCIYWSADLKGVMGLASSGPSATCKVSAPVAKIELRGITAVIECDEIAAKAWESSPWAR